MTTRAKVLALLAIIIVSYAVGRYSAPEKIKTLTQVVTVEKEKQKKDTKRHTETHTVTHADGTSETTVVSDSDTKTITKDDKSSSSTVEKEVVYSSSKVTVSGLAGIQLITPSTPIYGAAVTKPILGPLTVGVFGFQNSLVGVSVGLTF